MALFNLKQLWVAQEATFSTDPSADGSGYTALHAQDIAFAPSQLHIDRPLQNHKLTKLPGVIGAKGGTLTFKMEVRGTGTAAGNSTVANGGELHLLLSSSCGSVTAGIGTTCSAGWTSTVGAVASAAGIQIGDNIMINGEIRRVQNKATNTLTLDLALTTTPALSDVVYVGANYKPADESHTSLSFVLKQGGNVWVVMGCKGNVTLEGVSAAGRPLLSFNMQVDEWVETSTSVKSALPTLNPYLYPKGPTVLGCTLQYGTATLAVSEFAFDVGNAIEATPATEGSQGRSNFVVTDRNTVGSLKPLWAISKVADFVSGSAKTLVMPILDSAGTSLTKPTNAVAISIASASFVALPSVENVNNQMFLNMPFRVIQSDQSTVPDWVITVFGD
jgi:hypothetical protein